MKATIPHPSAQQLNAEQVVLDEIDIHDKEEDNAPGEDGAVDDQDKFDDDDEYNYYGNYDSEQIMNSSGAVYRARRRRIITCKNAKVAREKMLLCNTTRQRQIGRKFNEEMEENGYLILLL